MSTSEHFDATMLAEVREMEQSRTRYQLERPDALVDRNDPDVRRLLEALAYSTVRTRLATLRNLHATWRRLLSSYFHFILQPLPAMAMAQAVVTPNLADPVVLPRGTELRVTTLDGTVGSFQTLCELRVVPMVLEHCEILLRPQGFRLVLSFTSAFLRGDAVGLLRLAIHYLDDYLAALRVHTNLRQHFQRAFCVYDRAVSVDSDGPECAVTFGTRFDEPYETDDQNPLEGARGFFHFPQQDLMLHVEVPPPRQPWRRLSLCFDLAAAWPRNPPIYREIFCPFTVPVRNARRTPARIIECDGTRDSYPIRYIHDDPSYVLQRPHGVFRLTDEGTEPLRPGVLSDIAPSQDIEEQGAPGQLGHGYSLVLRMPQAFDQPERLLVDATWYQPRFADHAVGALKVMLADRSLLGLDWQIVGPVRAAVDSPLRQDPERLLALLALKMKPTLELAELHELLDMFATLAAGPYRGLGERLRDLATEVVPDGRLNGAGVRHLCHVAVAPGDADTEPLVARFLKELGVILDAWDYEAPVELVPHRTTAPLLRTRLRGRPR